MDALQKAIDELSSLDVSAGVEELEGTANRVAVDDKAMINCRADLNQLVPFRMTGPGKNTLMAVQIIGCRKKST